MGGRFFMPILLLITDLKFVLGHYIVFPQVNLGEGLAVPCLFLCQWGFSITPKRMGSGKSKGHERQSGLIAVIVGLCAAVSLNAVIYRELQKNDETPAAAE